MWKRNPEKIFSRHHVLGGIAQTLAGVIPLVLLILGGIASFKYMSSRKREEQLRAEAEYSVRRRLSYSWRPEWSYP